MILIHERDYKGTNATVLEFVHDDNCYCKYYEVVYILFHTGNENI